MSAVYDILIVGGGVNGCALARHAAKEGYSTALLEKNDFGCGVTSRSTRLIHGGLRYLESFQFRVVQESLRDRRAWFEDFPGQVAPLPFLIPVYGNDRRAPWYIHIGLTLYDWFARDPRLENFARVSPAETARSAPGLDQQGLKAGFVYYDGQATYPERVALEMALQAEEAGATIRNHTPATELLLEKGRILGVRSDSEEFRARLVVNASGAWIDHVNRLPPLRQKEDLLTRLNGAHIVVQPFDGAPQQAVYHEARSDGRPFFIVPWRRLLLIGTTETPYDGDPDTVQPFDREIEYLIKETNGLFPDAKLTGADVLYSYAGSRPLLRAKGSNLNKASRDHLVYDHESEEQTAGLLSMVGGKLTTAPSFARQALAEAAKKLGRPAPKRLPEGVPRDGLAGASVRLQEIYGPRLPALQRYVAQSSEPGVAVAEGAPATDAEVLYCLEREEARTLGDLLLRRTMLAFEPNYQPAWARAVARIVAKRLQWDDSAVEQHVADYEAELKRTLVRS